MINIVICLYLTHTLNYRLGNLINNQSCNSGESAPLRRRKTSKKRLQYLECNTIEVKYYDLLLSITLLTTLVFKIQVILGKNRYSLIKIFTPTSLSSKQPLSDVDAKLAKKDNSIQKVILCNLRYYDLLLFTTLTILVFEIQVTTRIYRQNQNYQNYHQNYYTHQLIYQATSSVTSLATLVTSFPPEWIARITQSIDPSAFSYTENMELPDIPLAVSHLCLIKGQLHFKFRFTHPEAHM
eukprot:TRINITY_DN17000_c0_g1_i10.p1 TRINITY_DN17000_c0_g1~~TRINITY_DN17000_c0_g1_i10.p1  ORF type:complete len:239 (-),score=-8.16 TRINITY_DN17000_c0_g1_i10:22-738(-)